MKGVTRNPFEDVAPDARPTKREEYIEEAYLSIMAEIRRVVFSGRALAIHVAVKNPGDLDVMTIGKATLGEVLALFLKDRDLSMVFERQGVSAKEPLTPKVSFALGDLTLYAAASSHDKNLAERMAIDRIACVISACGGRSPKAKATLNRYGVTVANRA